MWCNVKRELAATLLFGSVTLALLLSFPATADVEAEQPEWLPGSAFVQGGIFGCDCTAARDLNCGCLGP